MYSDQLNLFKDTVDAGDYVTYEMISQNGMNTIRRASTEHIGAADVAISSLENASIEIKNTIDTSNIESLNRHLVKISRNEIGTDGVARPASVHMVITRDKRVSDILVKRMAMQLASFISEAGVATLLLGDS